MIFSVNLKYIFRRIYPKHVFGNWHYIIRCHSSGKETFNIKIGNVSLVRQYPKFPELVPVNYNNQNLNSFQSILQHLRWIMQKDKLNQDIFLIGPPGPLKRTLTMLYLELTKKEVEYITLSRDTTESDIKQRREIKNKTAYYVDQCAVRAAIEGRVLVLDGIEKAERNVLPILNNLLENREMQLEDGRFLMAAERYDKLLKSYSREEMDKMKLVRVSEDFRVISLGLPVPRYPGNPLDPPLRSRFQARDVNVFPFKEHLELLKSCGKSVPEDKLILLLSAAYTLHSPESKSMGLLDFPLDQLAFLVQIMEKIPDVNLHNLLHLVYPYEVFLEKDGQKSVIDVLKKFDIEPNELSSEQPQLIIQENKKKDSSINVSIISEESSVKRKNYEVVTGNKTFAPEISADTKFINTKFHMNLLINMMHSHSVKDFCIIGSKGCGKSAVVKKFADMLGYDVQPIMLYEDMSARDLLQQRITTTNGDTMWKFSPLVTAALTGQMAILDGLHRINSGTLAVIHRLVQDRELQLFNGVRLLRVDRYEQVKSSSQLSDQELSERGILPIHPSFRLVALSEPPVTGSNTQQWLTAESLTVFLYHHMRPMTFEEEMEVISKVNNVNMEKIKKVLEFTHSLRNSQDGTMQSLASSLSTRQLLRISKRLASYQEESIFDTIQKACLFRFLPHLAKMTLKQTLGDFDINSSQPKDNSIEDLDKSITCEVKNGHVRIGRTKCNVYSSDSAAQVPDVLFYDNIQHLTVMEDMLKDFLLGEHLLLVGNQGVGKNKIVDRFLHLLNRPREYIQLHRDTTVQSLTLQATVHDGVIKYEDSPLVRAVKLGRVLVIDEADKAPTNVTCILKTLVESGSMILADGRRIVNYEDNSFVSDSNIIKMHPDFRMIVLANRPGFPFLGNDFFGTLGDIFSCHAVDNPSMNSEISMLQKYGPSVPIPIITQLVEAFSELRTMADEGLISYPYSTREIVNIVKHLQAFPEEGLVSVVRNVFDFDPYSEDMWETLKKTLQKHGIPIGVETSKINLAKEFPLPTVKYISNWDMRRQSNKPNESSYLPVEYKKIHEKKLPAAEVIAEQMDRINSRTLHFSEEEFHWKLPIGEYNVILDVAVTKYGNQLKDIIHVVTGNPIILFSMKSMNRTILSLPLHNVFHYTRGGYQPLIRLAPLSGDLLGELILHEGISNKILRIEPTVGKITQLTTDSLLQATAKEISYRIQGIDRGYYRMCPELSDKNILVFYQKNGNVLEVMDLNINQVYNIILPIKLKDVKLVSYDEWLLIENSSEKKYLLKKSIENQLEEMYAQIYLIEEKPPTGYVSDVSFTGLNRKDLSQLVGQNISAPNRLYTSPNNFLNVAVGFPSLESSIEVYSFPKENKLTYQNQPANHSVFLIDANQIVSAVPNRNHPEYNARDSEVGSQSYLEVIDLNEKKRRYICIPESSTTPPYTTWLSTISPSHILIDGMSNNGIVTVDAGGCIRLWETAIENLKLSLNQWKHMRGFNEEPAIQLSINEPDINQLEPKHGKIDPLHAPHIGGDTWAGGTGGRSTAGLGGVGGPYRLDAGHRIYQVPDHVKDRVPEEVKRAAREMGQRAYKEKLRQIRMSEYDAELYEQFMGNIKSHIQSLKVILESLQAKQKERQWLKNQTHGELDDTKLIDSLTGEKLIYKRRGEKEPEIGTPQQKPKKLKLLVDVSGSMYRFNSHDGRLHRIMEAALLVMEAFEKYSDKFQYEIIGHSGEDYSIKFTKNDSLPSNNKEKMDILKEMHAHSQFCMSGDHTLEATIHATDTLAKEEADERFVIMLSDANLDRYGIHPKHLTRVLTANADVNSFAVFIGSLGDQAIRLQKALPAGRGFVCLDTKLIPDILRQIFTSSILNK